MMMMVAMEMVEETAMAVTNMKNKKGFSLVEVLVATSIIAGSIMIASYFSIQQSKMVAKSEEKVETLGAEMEILSRSVRILTDVEDSSGLHTEGLCSFVNTDVKNYGIGNVFLEFTKDNVASVYSSANWKKVFGKDWEIVGSAANECKTGGGTVCLRLSKNSPLFQKLKAESGSAAKINSYAKVKVSPSVVFEKFASGGEIFPTIEHKGKWDAKAIGFNIETEVVVDKDGIRSNRRSNSSEFLWAADVEYCHVKRGKGVLSNPATGEAIRVLVSATGPGDPSGKKVYNSTQYKKTVDHPIDIKIPKTVPTQGKHVAGKSQVDPAYNIELACQEKVYRCRDDKKDREFSSSTRFNFFANYTSSNTLTQDPFVKFAPKLSLISSKDGSDLIASKRKEYLLNQTDPYIYYQDRDGERFYQDIGKENLDKLSFANRQKVASSLRQSATWLIKVKNTGNVCNRVCEGRSSGEELFFPRVDYTLYDIPTGSKPHYSHSFQSKMPMGCNVCYSKMCQGRTYKNFGAIQATNDPKHGPQPYEPVDGVMPECALRNTASVDAIQPYDKEESSPNSCVAAVVTKDGVKYSAENCSQRLPVMCFAYGNFMVAKDPFDGKGYEKHSFSEAGRRCYEMGRERLDRESMRERFEAFRSTFYNDFPPTTVGGKSDYINNAKAGMFLAPQSSQQEKELVRFMGIYQKDMYGKKVWTGLRVDQGGDLIQTPPEIHTKNVRREQFSVYYDSTSTIRMIKQAYGPSSIATSGSDAGILFHNVRFRGIKPASRSIGKEFRFVCRGRKSPYKVFVSSRRSSDFSDGESICRNQDGHFLPPTSPLGWAKAFQSIHPNESIYAYPNPTIAEKSANALSGAWVSMKKTGGTWDLSDTERVDKILKGSKTSKVDKFGTYVSEKIPDPVKVEEKARNVASLERSVKNKENQIAGMTKKIEKLDPIKDKDELEKLKSERDDEIAKLATLRSDLEQAKNVVVPLIPRPTKYVMCEKGETFSLRKSDRCSGGSRQVSENDLKGVLDRIKWIIASDSMPSGEFLQLGR